MSKLSKAPVRDRNRAIRQEALREQLAEQCRLQHILDNIVKMEDVSGSVKPENANMEMLEFQRIKAANDQRIKLMGKYLPDLKAIEHTGEISHVSETDTDTLYGQLKAIIEGSTQGAKGSTRTH